jgi:5-methylcytosine-specific restriction endonuclease McrA
VDTTSEEHEALRKVARAAQMKAYYEANREAIAAQMKAYREANREVIAARRKAYYEANRETVLARNKAHREASREAYAAQRKAHYEANREVILTRKKARNFRKTTIVNHLLVHQRGRCAICHCDVIENHHLDHIVPLAKGGTNERTNFQLLCPPCNLKKSAADPVEHAQRHGKLL